MDDVPAAARRMRLICDAYGLDDRVGLLPAIVWWQDRCQRGIEADAARGSAAMTRLRDSGLPEVRVHLIVDEGGKLYARLAKLRAALARHGIAREIRRASDQDGQV